MKRFFAAIIAFALFWAPATAQSFDNWAIQNYVSPTPPAGDNSDRNATTAFVKNGLSSQQFFIVCPLSQWVRSISENSSVCSQPTFSDIGGSFGGLNYTNSANSTGAARTLQSKLDDVVSAKDYGVKCDGSTDDAANIRIADAAAVAVGKSLRFPGGTCIVSSTITPATAARWLGDSYQATNLRANSATCSVLTVSNPFFTIENIQFSSTAICASGAFIAVSAGNFIARDILTSGGFFGITFGTAGSPVNASVVLIDNWQSLNTVTGGVDLVINNFSGANVEVHNVFMNNSALARPFAHINIISSQDFTCIHCNLLSAQNNLYINPGTGQSVVSTHFIGGFLDQSSTNALAILPTGNGNVQRISFVNTWFECANSSCTGANMTTAGTAIINGIDFTDCEFYSSSTTSSNGIVTSPGGGAISNLQILAGRIAGWTNGLNIAGVTNAYVRDARIGPVGSFAANSQGISLGGTITNLMVEDNDITGNTTAIANTSSATNLVIKGNAGYNPVGVSAITVGASPFTFNAGPTPTTVYINAGSGLTISVGGTAVFTVTPATIHLEPTESVTVAYSSPPSMVKSVH